MAIPNKEYIGDAVYVAYDGFGVVLTTEDGHSVTNRIVLEPEVWEHLEEYVTRLKTALSQQQLDRLKQEEEEEEEEKKIHDQSQS